MTKLKENEHLVSLKELDEFLNIATKQGVDFDTYEGSLLDNHIIYNGGYFSINGTDSKYILVEERYVNSWSSELVLILTDSDEEVEEFRSRFEELEEE